MTVDNYNNNKYISYPFIENAQLKGLSGLDFYEFSNEIFVDASLILTGTPYTGTLYFRRLMPVSGDIRQMQFLYQTENGGYIFTLLASADMAEYTKIKTATPAGILEITFGNVSDLFNPVHSNKDLLFNDCIINPTLIMNTTGHRLDGITVNGVTYTGDIKFREGYNMEISVLEGQNAIQFNAKKGAGRGEACESFWTVGHTKCNDCVFTINGLHPDWYGNFKIEAGEGLTLKYPGGNIIEIHSAVEQDNPDCQEVEK